MLFFENISIVLLGVNFVDKPVFRIKLHRKSIYWNYLGLNQHSGLYCGFLSPQDPFCYLFIYLLFIYAFSLSGYIASNERMIVNNELERKGCGRKQSWPNLRYYPVICLERIRTVLLSNDKMT
jgi:hypothetical protein